MILEKGGRMSEPTLDTIMQRVERLERAYRRWQLLGMVLFTLLGLSVLLGATGSTGSQTEQITAERFVVVDNAGHVRAILGAFEEKVGLYLLDKAGHQQVVLGLVDTAGHQQASLTLRDKAGHERATLMLWDKAGHHQVGLGFRDEAGQQQVGLDISDGTAGLSLGGKTGHKRVYLGVDKKEKDSSWLLFWDANGHPRVSLTLNNLAAHQQDHQETAEFTLSTPDGSYKALALSQDDLGSRQLSIGSHIAKESSLGTLVFLDKAGKEVWSVP